MRTVYDLYMSRKRQINIDKGQAQIASDRTKKAFDFFLFFFFYQSLIIKRIEIDRRSSLGVDLRIRLLSVVVQDQILFLPRITESSINNLHYSLARNVELIQRWQTNTLVSLYILCPCICLRGATTSYFSTTKWKIDDGSTIDSRGFLWPPWEEI